MFVQTEKFIHEHNGDPKDIAIYGQEVIEETWRMAKMNLAIHGIDNKGLGARWGDTFARDQHADIQMDYVMANPPFNIKHWSRNAEDPRWKFGVPPANNANYAWVQHILYKLAPGGSAGVVMANGSMSSNSNGEGGIRAQIVEADLVSCMVALPTQLFRSTGIPVCVVVLHQGQERWETTERPTGPARFCSSTPANSVIWWTAPNAALTNNDIARIAGTYHAWRGASSVMASKLEYEDIPGFCKSVDLADIKESDYALTPGRYVGAAEIEDDGEPIDDKIRRLSKGTTGGI